MPHMTELDEPCRGVDGAFISSVYKLIPIHNLLHEIKTESVGYDVVLSYE